MTDVPDSVLALVAPGTRVRHDEHGEGVIVSVDRSGSDLYVTVMFQVQRLTWDEMLRLGDGDVDHEPDLEVRVPLHTILTGERWHAAEQQAEDPEVNTLDTVESPARASRPRRGLRSIPERDIAKMLDDAVGVPAMADAMVVAVDWAWANLMSLVTKGSDSGMDMQEIRKELATHLGVDLWQTKVWPAAPEEFRVSFDLLMADLVRDLTPGPSDEDIRSTAVSLLDSVEGRLQRVHGDTLRSRARSRSRTRGRTR